MANDDFLEVNGNNWNSRDARFPLSRSFFKFPTSREGSRVLSLSPYPYMTARTN